MLVWVDDKSDTDVSKTKVALINFIIAFVMSDKPEDEILVDIYKLMTLVKNMFEGSKIKADDVIMASVNAKITGKVNITKEG